MNTKEIKSCFNKALLVFLFFTLICGVLYPGLIAGFSVFFKPNTDSAAALAQPVSSDAYFSGRQENWTTVTLKDGSHALYALPENVNSDGPEYEARVSKLAKELQKKYDNDAAVPVDLVTASGSGMDPDISPAAASWQAAHIAQVRGLTLGQVDDVIREATTGKFLGIFGEESVNVLKANTLLDKLS